MSDNTITYRIRCGCVILGASGPDLDSRIIHHGCARAKLCNAKFTDILKRLIPYMLDAGFDDHDVGKLSLFYFLMYMKKRLDDKQFLDECISKRKETFRALSDTVRRERLARA